MAVQEAVAWKYTPAVSMIQEAPARDEAPTATHTCPDFESNVVAGPWKRSAAVVAVSVEGTGEIGDDHAPAGVVGNAVIAALCAGAAKVLNCPKYAVKAGAAPEYLAFIVRTGLENAMLPATYTVGEQNAM